MKDISLDMKRVACIVLGGGEGTRLHPLTLTRAKPAINFGGKYRLIDVPISCAIHAGCRQIFVLTQFFSSSLHHHIFQTYIQGGITANLVEVLTAEQKPSQKKWFQGNADAVRQNLDYLLEFPFDYFLILSGDQLYNLSLEKMMEFALQSQADAVIASLPISEENAKRLGVLKINEDHFITDFHEKPQDLQILKSLKNPAGFNKKKGLINDKNRSYLGSMGIYLFKRKILADMLKNDLREDFGKHLIPDLIKKGKTAAFLYDGYWEDIGTVSTFYAANMALTQSNPAFKLYDEQRPILTPQWNLPPAKIVSSKIDRVLISEGAVLDHVKATRSIIGPRTIIEKGTVISDSYLMGNDYYYRPYEEDIHLPSQPLIGKNCTILKAIIDKNTRIGNNVSLINSQKLTHYDGDQVFIREGIIIIPRGAILPDGFTI